MRIQGKFGALLRFTALVGFCLFAGCGCGTAVKDFRIIRGQFGNQIRETAGSSVWICPGESVTMGWTTENADTALIDNGVGPVPAAAGTVTVTPTAETHYKIQAKKGDCEDSKTVDFYVVGANSSLSATATRLPGNPPYVWEAKLLPQFYSPNIVASTGWLMSPATQGGWVAKETDVNGGLHNLPLGLDALHPAAFGGPTPVAGTWDIAPINQNEVGTEPPSAAQFGLGIKCK